MELDAHAIQTQNVLMCIRHWHCRGESDSCNTLHSLVRAGGEHTPPGGRVFHKQPPKV